MKTERVARSATLDRFLDPEEAILWEGRPGASQWFGMGLWFGAIGIVVLLMTAGASIGATGFDAITIIGISFFTVVGCVLVLAPLVGWLAAKRTCYAITDRRVILRTPRLGRGSDLTSVYPAELTLLIRQDSPRRSGYLRSDRYHRSARQAEAAPPYLTAMGLWGIADAKAVEAIIREQFLISLHAPVDLQDLARPGAIDPALSELVQPELYDDEHLVWAQQPNPPSMAKKAIPLSLFGICFLGAAAGCLFMLPAQAAALLILLPFVGIFSAVGFCLLLSPAWLWRSAQSTAYALTDQRCLIVKGRAGRRRRVTSFFPPEMKYIWREEGRDGFGDVVFGRADQAQGQRSVDRLAEPCGFTAIDNPAAVGRLIRRTLAPKPEPPDLS